MVDAVAACRWDAKRVNETGNYVVAIYLLLLCVAHVGSTLCEHVARKGRNRGIPKFGDKSRASDTYPAIVNSPY
ncbi:hypothetical protein GGR52DRAFT_536558 [Hypoxylon sp. FL1284]|nr:hypothetical protein GGR52DRAFT_536558 [Hypoxylon sp. FL1284]